MVDLIVGDEEKDDVSSDSQEPEQEDKERLSSGEEFYRQNSIRIKGLNDLNAPFPNGMRMMIIERNERVDYVVISKGGKERRYSLHRNTGRVTLNNMDCKQDEKDQLIKLIRYMDDHCNSMNSRTIEYNLS